MNDFQCIVAMDLTLLEKSYANSAFAFACRKILYRLQSVVEYDNKSYKNWFWFQALVFIICMVTDYYLTVAYTKGVWEGEQWPTARNQYVTGWTPFLIIHTHCLVQLNFISFQSIYNCLLCTSSWIHVHVGLLVYLYTSG